MKYEKEICKRRATVRKVEMQLLLDEVDHRSVLFFLFKCNVSNKAETAVWTNIAKKKQSGGRMEGGGEDGWWPKGTSTSQLSGDGTSTQSPEPTSVPLSSIAHPPPHMTGAEHRPTEDLGWEVECQGRESCAAAAVKTSYSWKKWWSCGESSRSWRGPQNSSRRRWTSKGPNSTSSRGN